MTIKEVLKKITKYEAKMIEAQIAGDTYTYKLFNDAKEIYSDILKEMLNSEN